MFLKLEEMTVEQKLGMVLCARRFQEDDVDYIIERVKNRALGCVQGPADRPEIVEKILAAADYPILVINDTERGFPTSNLPKIPLNSLAATDDPKYLRAFARGIVRDAKRAGFNGTWGPIVDVLEGNGPCTISRVFSDEKEKVARMAAEVADVFRQNHYLSCGKHYPGSSGLTEDTHMQEGFSIFSKEYIEEVNLFPYRYLLERGLLPSVMVGHTVFDRIDPDFPASLSKKCMDLLRSIGFDGVAFTDSFAMMGVLQRFGEENIYGMAVNAGIDIVLPNYRTSVKDCFDMLRENFESGAFSEERLDEAVRRVLTAMEFVGTPPEHPTEFTPEDEALLQEVARKSLTAVVDEGVSQALTQENPKKLFVIITENGFQEEVSSAEITTGSWYDPIAVANRIRENFPESTLRFIPEFATAPEQEALLNLAVQFKEVVVVTYCKTAAYLGTDCLTRRSEAWINALQHAGKVSAVVHFGNPFALQKIRHVPRRIFAYIMKEAQPYAIDVLAGKLQAEGRLPYQVDLP